MCMADKNGYPFFCQLQKPTASSSFCRLTNIRASPTRLLRLEFLMFLPIDWSRPLLKFRRTLVRVSDRARSDHRPAPAAGGEIVRWPIFLAFRRENFYF